MGDGILWVAAANVVIWTGIFLYLMRLERRLTAAEGKRSQS